MRKFTIFICASFFIFSFANAQITKGSLLLGGNFSFGLGKAKTDNMPSATAENHSYLINPALGIAIRQNLIAGLGASYGHDRSKLENQNFDNNESTSYGASGFLRKYMQLGKSFYLFGEGSAYFNKRKENARNSPSIDRTTKTTQIGLSLQPGISYALNKKFHIEAGLNNLVNIYYSKQSYEFPPVPLNNSTSESLNFNMYLSGDNNFFLGFRFLFSN